MIDDPNHPGAGPSRETIRNLHGMLGSMEKVLSKKLEKEERKHKAVILGSITKARQICTVCLSLFDMAATTPEAIPKPGICFSCKAQLDDGWTAYTCGRDIAFFKSPQTQQDAGKIIEVKPATMTALKAAGAKMQEKRDDNAPNH